MTAENGIIVRRLFEEIGRGNLAVEDAILSDRLVFHCLSTGGDEDCEGLKRRFAVYRAAFTELLAGVEDEISEGDRVAARITWSGSCPGAALGSATTVTQVKWAEAVIFRLDQGQIVEGWGNTGLAEGFGDGFGDGLLEDGHYDAEVGAIGSSSPGLVVLPARETQIEESYFPVAETLRGHVTSQQEQLEAKDQQISELHLLLQQAQTALAVPIQSQKRVSWWRWLLGWEH